MPRARNIKPSFFTNDILAECTPLARIMFIGLWTISDREGRLEDRPKKIKAETLPYDNCDPDKLLDELYTRGFIIRYEHENKEYIQIVNFTKHQNCHVKESASTIPAPCKTGAKLVKKSLLTESFLLNPESLLLKPDNVREEFERSFNFFWNAFPKNNRSKGSRKDAENKFKTALTKDTFENIMEGVRKYETYIRNTGQSNKDAFRWLEKECWRDDYAIQSYELPRKATADDNITAGAYAALLELTERQGY